VENDNLKLTAELEFQSEVKGLFTRSVMLLI